MIGYYRIRKYLKILFKEEKFDIIWFKLCNFFSEKKQKKYYMPYYISKCKKPQKKYYIFRISMGSYHILSAAKHYIGCCEWAEENGYIPILDNEYECNYENNCMGNDNFFELVFKQQTPIKEVLKEKYVYVGKLNDFKTTASFYEIADCIGCCIKCTDDVGWRNYYSTMNSYVKKWLPFNNDFLIRCKNEIPITDSDKNVLGVIAKEDFMSNVSDNEQLTDDVKKMMTLHPRSISIEEYIVVIKEFIQKYNINKIFLSCQCADTVEMLNSHLNVEILVVERERDSLADFIDNAMNKVIYQNQQSHNNILKYCEEIVGISKCDYLIANKSSGTAMALALNCGKYKDIYISPDLNNCEYW